MKEQYDLIKEEDIQKESPFTDKVLERIKEMISKMSDDERMELAELMEPEIIEQYL